MTTHTDRIRQMAQEATYYADAMDGSGQMAGRIWSDVRDEHFAQLVAEDCAQLVETDPYFEDAPGHVRSGLFALAQAIRARYSLKD